MLKLGFEEGRGARRIASASNGGIRFWLRETRRAATDEK